VALLPLRFIFGLTFLYAGLDKLLDPTFLHDSGRGSIGAQMAAWVAVSPLGDLISAFLPYAVPVGLAIAMAELCVGIGALIGLAYRLAALGGLLLSLLFLLTASWAVRPFYLGNDLPYAAGWLTLFLAGSGGLLTVDAWLGARARRRQVLGVRPPRFSRERRIILRAAALGAVAVCVASVAAVLEVALGTSDDDVRGPTVSPTPTIGGGSPSPNVPAPPLASPSPPGSPSPSPLGKLLAHVRDVTPTHPVVFQDPYTGDPGILLRLNDGQFVAFDAVCTHAGCTVEFDPPTGYLVCPCHAAVFDPARGAKAIEGPTFTPLTAFPIRVDQAAGTIQLVGE
jgi:thiosulfate dehydrogenase (quinone) large subunit